MKISKFVIKYSSFEFKTAVQKATVGYWCLNHLLYYIITYIGEVLVYFHKYFR